MTRIEKINAVYTNFKETKLEEDIKSLAKEKLKLERENQILSKQKSTISNQMNESNTDMTYKPCKSCKSYEEKYKSYEENCISYEEKCKSYEEKIRSKESLHSEMVLDYEIEKSKLQNSAKISKLENESLQKSMNILQNENNSYESKIDSKNKVIEELELKLKSLTQKNLVQNAEIFSIKLHNSRQGDFLLTQSNISLEISSFTHDTHSPDENNNNTSDTKFKASVGIQNKSKTNKELDHDWPKVERRENTRTRDNIRQKKNVLFIGTSNIRYVSANELAGKSTYVKKTEIMETLRLKRLK